MKHKGNAGAGFFVFTKGKRDPELTLRQIGAWISKKRRVFVEPNLNEGESVFRRECINFAWVAQWVGVLDYFAEVLVKKLKKANIDLTAVAPLPEDDVFGFPVARRSSRGLLQATRPCTTSDDVFRFRTEVGKKERVLVLLGLISSSTVPDIELMIESVERAGGRVVGIACAVNDTFPAAQKISGIDVVSVIESGIERFPFSMIGSDDEVIENPFLPDVWKRLIPSKKK